MGTIVIKAYGKTLYDKTIPDKVAFAIYKEREAKDLEFKKKCIADRPEEGKTEIVEAPWTKKT